MNTTNIIRKSTLSAVLGGFAVAAILGSQPQSASAAAPIDLKSSSLYGLANQAADGTFTLTFNGQAASSTTQIPTSYRMRLPTRTTAGGKVEFEWKVEEGEASITPIDGLKGNGNVLEPGKVEHEWTVEEG